LPEKGDRLIIFIDELDRCNPSFAVKLLERIKHYFSNDKITFIFSVNLIELQNTIRQHYGINFNASKYLNRFFDLPVSLSSPDIQKYYNSIGFDASYFIYDNIAKAVISKYNFSLREMAKYLHHIKISAYKTTHKNTSSYSVFPNSKSREFCLFYIVPILIGLKIHDINLYKNTIEGIDSSQLIEILCNENSYFSVCTELLGVNETYDNTVSNKTIVKMQDKINEMYSAIFIEDYSGGIYEKNIGKLRFTQANKQDLLKVISLFSEHASLY